MKPTRNFTLTLLAVSTLGFASPVLAGSKSELLEGIAGRWWDRHRPGKVGHPEAPVNGQMQALTNVVSHAQWDNVARMRIGELFITEAGLPGHKEQVQALFNQMAKAAKNGSIPADEARTVLASLAETMQRSLQRAQFDVPQDALTATDLGTLYFGKQGDKSWAFFQPS